LKNSVITNASLIVVGKKYYASAIRQSVLKQLHSDGNRTFEMHV